MWVHYFLANTIDQLSKPLSIGNITIANRVFGAPMSGVSDRPFRRRVLNAGAGLAVAEMVSASELVKDRRGSLNRIRRIDGAVHSVQIAGCQVDDLQEATRICAGEGADLIDINMGCPAKKVTGGYAGSALMRDADNAIILVESVVKASPVPVTLKMRLGWDDSALNAPDIAARAEAVGIQMITVHGRTREQMYKGQANWQAIAKVRAAVTIPLVVNGDITSIDKATEALAQSGADAVMMGRGLYGAPWKVADVLGLTGKAPLNIADYVIAHHEAMLNHYPEAQGLRHARKHLGWYLDRAAEPPPAHLRKIILTSLNAEEIHAALREALAQSTLESAA